MTDNATSANPGLPVARPSQRDTAITAAVKHQPRLTSTHLPRQDTLARLLSVRKLSTNSRAARPAPPRAGCGRPQAAVLAGASTPLHGPTRRSALGPPRLASAAATAIRDRSP